MDASEMPERAEVRFHCVGHAVGRMRNDLSVTMVKPFAEGPFEMATDEGSFHGGEASAPPPLALFVGGLTGCIMTQMRAFAKRLDITLTDLSVDTRVVWDWQATGRTYETAPKAFEIDVSIVSDDPHERLVELIETAKRGCFIEQTLAVPNTIRHRLKTADGWVEV